LFKAVTGINTSFLAKLATTSVRDRDQVAHSIKHVAAISEHYVPSDTDYISTTRLGNTQFHDWLPSYFGAKKTYWEKKGVISSSLEKTKSSHGTAVGHAPDNDWDSC
jgi:hypothetical protein